MTNHTHSIYIICVKAWHNLCWEIYEFNVIINQRILFPILYIHINTKNYERQLMPLKMWSVSNHRIHSISLEIYMHICRCIYPHVECLDFMLQCMHRRGAWLWVIIYHLRKDYALFIFLSKYKYIHTYIFMMNSSKTNV